MRENRDCGVLDGFGPTKTRQSEAAACDINNIMARYKKTGVIPVVDRPVLYQDVAEIGDFRSVLDRVDRANKMFMKLPAKVRAEFGNDVATFLDFTSDPANRDQMVEMGLIDVKAAPEPPKPPVEPAAVEKPPTE